MISIISITSVISKTSCIQFVSLSPFSSFFRSSGGRAGVGGEHLLLSFLLPCSKRWHGLLQIFVISKHMQPKGFVFLKI